MPALQHIFHLFSNPYAFVSKFAVILLINIPNMSSKVSICFVLSVTLYIITKDRRANIELKEWLCSFIIPAEH